MTRKAGNEWLKLVCTGFFLGATPQISPGAVDFLFSYTNSIAINTDVNPPTSATPYPSGITVAGLNGQIVTRVTVTLNGLSHQSASDVSILLVGPRGQEAIVMSETGGQYAFPVTNLVITLDDDAADFLPVDSLLISGTFKPTNGYLSFGRTNLPYDFPVPAPPGNSNSMSALSVFKNTDPTGTWNLFVVDDAYPHSGSIANGWSLNLSVAVPLQIARFETNVVVSWPASATNGHLQLSPSLPGANIWSNVVATPISVAGRLCVTNPISGEGAFYRLLAN
jgi:subtilisin-like proprotein convertase family protein